MHQRPRPRIDLTETAFVFWRGTSGLHYAHTVYTLTGCPPLPPASVMLVERSADGFRRICQVLTVDDRAPTLNLATIRQRGAALGANEVHVHFAAGIAEARITAAMDLGVQYGSFNVVGN